MIRKVLLFGVALTVVAGIVFWRRTATPLEEAHVAGRRVTVWSRLAQVRESVAELNHGDRVAILERKEGNVRIQTADGRTGWISEHNLMGPGAREKAQELREKTRQMPVQARGHTRVVSNVRAEAGRAAPRIFQFRPGVPVEVLLRAIAEVPLAEDSRGQAAAATETRGSEAPARREDWYLVRATTEEAGEISGWVLARFIEIDLPPEIRDFAAGIRFIAAFELNRVPDEGGERPQFLALGVRGGEGQPCDFTLLRVFTWNTERKHYETAYLESALCGKLPVRFERREALTLFRFSAAERGGQIQREYQMRGTIVRRVRAPSK